MNWLTQRLSGVPNTFLLAWGWRRRLLTLGCGALAALSLPPFDLYPVLLVSFSALVWLLDGALEPDGGRLPGALRTGFVTGWLFGFGYFLAGLWWIGGAFLVEAERFAVLMPLAVLAMPAGLALFTGAGVALAASLWNERFSRVLLLAACLTLADWLRGHVLTGFPWNAFGYGVSGSLTLMQAASLVGLYGLGFLVVAAAATPALLADARPLALRFRPLLAAVVTVVVVVAFGTLRLWQSVPPPADLDIRIVQPSIDQRDKWRPEMRDEIFRTFLDMTEAPLAGAARVGQKRLVIWPESAVPFLLTQEPGALFRIASALGGNAELALGAIRAEAGAAGPAYYNSVYLLGGDGTVRGVYDKVRLVPFGEYVPLKGLLERLGISSLAGPLSGFEAGYQPRVLTTAAGFGFLPLICYEAIFPGATQSVVPRPSFLLNVTNDAWFGRTPGPHQHLAQARLRAIETGLPLVRAANTGISAIIDPMGRMTARLGIYERGLLDAPLPDRIGKTYYGILGDAPALIASLVLVIFAGLLRHNRHSRVN